MMSYTPAATHAPALSPRRFLAPALIACYVAWGILLMVSHAADHFDALDVTRYVLLAYLAGFLLLLTWLRPLVRRWSLTTGAKYVLLSLMSAAVVEVAHIFSDPFSDSVKVTFGETPAHIILRNIVVDLAVTLPAYAIVFTLVWRRVLARYRYSFIEFILLISVAQFLGDGHVYVVLNVASALLFGPYIFLIYHILNIPPYLLMKDEIEAALPASGGQNGGRYIGFWIVPATYWAYIAVVVALAVIGAVLWKIV